MIRIRNLRTYLASRLLNGCKRIRGGDLGFCWLLHHSDMVCTLKPPSNIMSYNWFGYLMIETRAQFMNLCMQFMYGEYDGLFKEDLVSKGRYSRTW